MHATVSSLNVENLRNSNVKTDFQEYICWERAVFERLKASNNKQIEYVPCIPNYLSIFYKLSKGYKNMYYVLIDKKKINSFSKQLDRNCICLYRKRLEIFLNSHIKSQKNPNFYGCNSRFYIEFRKRFGTFLNSK